MWCIKTVTLTKNFSSETIRRINQKKKFEELNKKDFLIIFLFFTAIFITVIIWWTYDDIKASKENLDSEFNGKVEYVMYDIKGFPTFRVHDKTFYIGAGYNVNHAIQLGDSLVKRKGSNIYKLIKNKSEQVIQFNN